MTAFLPTQYANVEEKQHAASSRNKLDSQNYPVQNNLNDLLIFPIISFVTCYEQQLQQEITVHMINTF